MSVCFNTLRALSRSRVPASKTLLPFLYQTPTIQQWRPAAQSIARRTASSRSNDNDDIPFEDEILPTPIDQVDSSRKTTITGSERAAFEKLYKTVNAQGKPQGNYHEVKLDQIADEYYEEEDDDGSPVSIDSLFDAVLQGSPHRHEAPTAMTKKPMSPVRDGAKEELESPVQEESAAINTTLKQERERVSKLLRSAQTDREVWEILDREVFARIRDLDLDGRKKAVKKAFKSMKSPIQQYSAKDTEEYKASIPHFPTSLTESSYSPPKAELAVSSPRIFFPNYPHHLVVAVQVLRKHFPTSPLSLCILPTVKSLGRSSYALGATTDLYKQLLYNAWLQHSSYSLVDSLLTDMDNGGIEFDVNILRLLDEISKEYKMAMNQKLGRTMKLVLQMEQYEEGWKRIQIWRETVATRLGDWSTSLTDKRTLVRKFDPLENTWKTLPRLVGPRDEISLELSKNAEGGDALGRGVKRDSFQSGQSESTKLPLNEETGTV